MPAPANPHDRYFKRIFGDTEVAREFFAQHLPSAVVERLDFGTLQAAKDSFIDDDLRGSYSDLLFTVQRIGGGEALIYLLLEHKSQPDRLTPFQMLRYVVRINEQRLRNDQPLCVVIPLVLYHGPDAWNVPRTMEELIAVPPPFATFTPRLSLVLIDLSQHPDEELRGQAVLHASLLMLKYISRSDLRDQLPGIVQLLSQLLHEPNGIECLRIMLNYLASAAERLTPQELVQAVDSHLQDKSGNSLMPTIAEQWIQEGIEKGIEKGIERGQQIGRIHLCERLLNRPSTPRDELNRLTPEELERRASDLEKLLRPA
jgi:predicted transposase/invertase (TIGR01784 family)